MTKPLKASLVIMAKDPIPGQVKTRLSPPLSPAEAAELYCCFLEDRIAEMSTLKGVDLALAYTPENAKPTFRALVSDSIQLFAQRGKNLTEKLVNIFKDLLSEGYQTVSIIDSDTPDLSSAIMRQSFNLLASEHTDAVFGPCKDGGYYLIGLKKNYPKLFQNIPWSGKNVLAVSLKKAKEMGLKTALLPLQNDIDTYEDLLDFFHRNKDRVSDDNWPGQKTITFLKNRLQHKRFETS